MEKKKVESARLIGLWLARHRNANAWYHIYPFAMANNNLKLNIVRHQKATQEIPNIVYHLYKSKNLPIDLIKIFLLGFKVLLTNKIDYIVTFNPVPWGSIAWILAKIFRKPIILGFIGADYNHYLKNTKWKYFLRHAARNSDIVTVTGNNMKEGFIKLGVNKNNIYTYPHCVKDEYFTTELNVVKVYDLITVCNLIPRKRVQDIIFAVDVLVKNGVNVNLCIVGDGVEGDYLRSIVVEKGLEKQVFFVGWQNNVFDYLNQSKIYVQASSAEGFSISLIEAIASALIPITTVVGSEADYIQDGYNGFIFEVGNYKQLAQKIERALDSSLYSELRDNVLKGRDHFRIKTAVSVCEGILSELNMRNYGQKS